MTLAAALMNGYSPNDSVDGTEPCPVPSRFPEVPPEQWPNNSADGDENGMHSLDHSTADSINCAFVRIATSVGYDKVIATAHAMGITQGQPRADPQPHAGHASGRTPRPWPTVMATIANGGVHHTPFVVQKIVGPDGQVLIDKANNPGDAALDADVADCEQNVLRDVSPAAPAGTRRSTGQNIFGKTGTTDHTHRRVVHRREPPWPGMQLATAVWFGNSHRRTSGAAGFGGDSAAPVFQPFMSEALAGSGSERVARPGAGLRAARRQSSTRTAGATPAPVAPVPPGSRRSSPRCSSCPPRPRPPAAPAPTTPRSTAAGQPRERERRTVTGELDVLLTLQEHDTTLERLLHRHQTLPERDALHAAEAAGRAARRGN